MNKRFTWAKVVLFATPLSLFCLGKYLHTTHQDTFTTQLRGMAGANASSCGVWPNADNDQQLRECMAKAVAQVRPFWARQERHYFNVHNMSEQWDVSEGYVFTPQRMFFHIERYPPSGFRPARIIKKRWANPHAVTYPSGIVDVWRDSEARVED